MGETRTADPTLTAYAEEHGEGVDVAVLNPYEDGAIAHKINGHSTVACGSIPTWHFTHPAMLARWVCKPCKRCFPAAR